MAIAYQSIGTVTYASGNTVTIPKPSGLAVGDLMVAMVHQKDVDTATCTLAGWTAIDTMDLNITSGDFAWTLYKVADAADVLLTQFVFVLNRTAYVAGAIFRIDGQAASSQINAHAWAEHSSNTTSHTYADTITPSVANCLLLIGVFNSGNVTNSGYAIATDNPTWTEAFDVGSAGAARAFAGAYANRPETSATGNSASTTSANDYSSSTIIAIAPLASSGPTNLKSLDTNVKANIKSYNTNVIANIKSINTNT